jgi:hypothetical protein
MLKNCKENLSQIKQILALRNADSTGYSEIISAPNYMRHNTDTTEVSKVSLCAEISCFAVHEMLEVHSPMQCQLQVFKLACFSKQGTKWSTLESSFYFIFKSKKLIRSTHYSPRIERKMPSQEVGS